MRTKAFVKDPFVGCAWASEAPAPGTHAQVKASTAKPRRAAMPEEQMLTQGADDKATQKCSDRIVAEPAHPHLNARQPFVRDRVQMLTPSHFKDEVPRLDPDQWLTRKQFQMVDRVGEVFASGTEPEYNVLVFMHQAFPEWNGCTLKGMLLAGAAFCEYLAWLEAAPGIRWRDEW